MSEAREVGDNYLPIGYVLTPYGEKIEREMCEYFGFPSPPTKAEGLVMEAIWHKLSLLWPNPYTSPVARHAEGQAAPQPATETQRITAEELADRLWLTFPVEHREHSQAVNWKLEVIEAFRNFHASQSAADAGVRKALETGLLNVLNETTDCDAYQVVRKVRGLVFAALKAASCRERRSEYEWNLRSTER